MREKEKGFVKEILIIALAIVVLSKLGIDVDVLARKIEGVFNWFMSLI